MKKMVFFLVCIGMCVTLFAQQLTVAVSKFDVKNGVTANVAEAVTELFIAELVKNGSMRVVDRNSFDKIMAEMRFQASDWADRNRVAQLGRALNANSIIRGNVMILAGQTVVNAAVLDINTAQILSSSMIRMGDIGEVFTRLPDLVKSTVPNLANSSSSNSLLTAAVSSFDIRGGLTAAEVEVIMELFTTELVANKAKVVDRNSFDKIMTEMKFQTSDWADSNKVARLGRALNANSIVRGTVMSLAGQTVITSTVLDINTAEIISSSTLQMSGINEIYSKLPSFAFEILFNVPQTTRGYYMPGDRSPSGGFVFYDKGVFSNGWRYLEAAPAETKFSARWGAYTVTVTPNSNSTSGSSSRSSSNRRKGSSNIFAPIVGALLGVPLIDHYNFRDVPGTATIVGSGKQNTELIVERLRGWGETERAAQKCAGLDFGGHTDWFLPSKDELDLMYKNLKQKGLGGFSDEWYWSSSQSGGSLARIQRFSDGLQTSSFNEFTYSVRAVRAF